MESTKPSEVDVQGWLSSLSTWGKWGPDDDLGTLNYVGDDQRRAAARLVHGGAVVSCSLPLDPRSLESPLKLRPDPEDSFWTRPGRFVIQDGATATDGEIQHMAFDAFLLAPHGTTMTHIDAPSHTVFRGSIYNGHSPSSAFADSRTGSVDALANGVFGRAVLLDVPLVRGQRWLEPGDAIYPADLESCETRLGAEIRPGDLLFVRTGYRLYAPHGSNERFGPRPGLQASCLPWLSERQVAVVGSDVAIDVMPHGYDLGLPIHTVGMWAMGLWLIDNCGLDHLARTCSSLERWEFASVLAPLALTAGTGSPLNPLALF
jgi:kynurenine formamidase